MTFNLIHTSWLPVRRASGRRTMISPIDLTDDISANPIIAFDWSRADFDAASREFMIGLLSTACAAQIIRRQAWKHWWEKPPAAEVLADAFKPLEPAFDLDGDGPRFMQDMTLDGPVDAPVGALLIDSPGNNALKNNTDFFVKRGRIEQLSRSAAAMALYQLQTYAPSGGAGHRVGLRGGGPLTCEVLAGTGTISLWHQLWLNVFADHDWLAEASAQKPIFPWMVPIRFSEKGLATTPEHAHPAYCFWGMPRRIRLDFEAGGDASCSLTGVEDPIQVRSFATKPHGNKYEAWGMRHPLTPHYRQKPTSEWLALHPQPGRMGYQDWIGIIVSDGGEGSALRMPARIVQIALGRLPGYVEKSWRLRLTGFDNDNMKARGFIECEMPLLMVDEETRPAVEQLIRDLILGANEVENLTGYAITTALGEMKRDQGVRWQVSERFWSDTEPDFLDLVSVRMEHSTDAAGKLAISRDWISILRRTSLAIFDELVPPTAIDSGDPLKYVKARSMLHRALQGYDKMGNRIFKALNLEPPTKGKAAIRPQVEEAAS
ncbi:MAG: type I-E CRISPR-associated protein Cse1/CasA [Geminicoccaceae bacterium]